MRGFARFGDAGRSLRRFFTPRRNHFAAPRKGDVKVVPRGGIEPSTHGFSDHTEENEEDPSKHNKTLDKPEKPPEPVGGG